MEKEAKARAELLSDAIHDACAARRAGRLLEAVFYFGKAIELCDEKNAGDMRIRSKLRVDRGTCYLMLGMYYQADRDLASLTRQEVHQLSTRDLVLLALKRADAVYYMRIPGRSGLHFLGHALLMLSVYPSCLTAIQYVESVQVYVARIAYHSAIVPLTPVAIQAVLGLVRPAWSAFRARGMVLEYWQTLETLFRLAEDIHGQMYAVTQQIAAGMETSALRTARRKLCILMAADLDR